MSEPSLKQRTIGALLWNLLDRMGQQVLLFIVGVLVANILSVEDYALVGMLAIFSAIQHLHQRLPLSAVIRLLSAHRRILQPAFTDRPCQGYFPCASL